MATITDIPLEDIKNFLISNDRPVPPTTNRIYLTALDLIRSKTAQVIPPLIADWIIAYDLLNRKINVPIYRATDIILSSDNNLYDLANLLTLSHIDKERILRILTYLGVLDNNTKLLDELSPEIIYAIISKLDCKSMFLLCEVSSTFDIFCHDNLDALLREKLSQITGSNLITYDRSELVRLCQFQSSNEPNNISTGFSHTLLLKFNGQVYSCGSNNLGELGLGDTITKNSPILINSLNNIVQVSAGNSFSLALDNIGNVYSFGSNIVGCLGLGQSSVILRATAVPILMFYRTIKISARGKHALVL